MIVRTSRIRASLWSLVGFVVVAVLIGRGPGLLVASGLADSPNPLVSEAAFTLAIYGALLVLAVAGGFATGVRALGGGPAPLVRLGQGIAIGAAAILLAIGYCAIVGTLSRGDSAAGPSAALALGLGLVAVQVVAEEAYFRGWLQPLLASAWGNRVAIPVVAIGFALLHIAGGVRGAVEIANLVLGGALFGLLAARGGGIAAACGAHLAWNAIEQLGVALDPNPGIGAFGTLVDLDLVGPARWGGSDAGLNASVAMSFGLAALLVPLLIATRTRSVDRAAAGVDAVA